MRLIGTVAVIIAIVRHRPTHCNNERRRDCNDEHIRGGSRLVSLSTCGRAQMSVCSPVNVGLSGVSFADWAVSHPVHASSAVCEALAPFNIRANHLVYIAQYGTVCFEQCHSKCRIEEHEMLAFSSLNSFPSKRLSSVLTWMICRIISNLSHQYQINSSRTINW